VIAATAQQTVRTRRKQDAIRRSAPGFITAGSVSIYGDLLIRRDNNGVGDLRTASVTLLMF
jgi:hypothetical protein